MVVCTIYQKFHVTKTPTDNFDSIILDKRIKILPATFAVCQQVNLETIKIKAMARKATSNGFMEQTNRVFLGTFTLSPA